jgi:cytoskeletal protein RodZ
VYPDIEKLAYFGFDSLGFNWPKALVLFPWHSLTLSSRPWEHAHKELLIAIEILVFVVMMAGMWWLATHRRNRQDRFIPPLSLDVVKQRALRNPSTSL